MIGLMVLAPLKLLAADIISWTTPDSPPRFINDGTFANQGYGDRQLHHLFNWLLGWDHHILQVDVATVWHEMALHDGICMIGVLRTPEREALYRFSDRFVRIPAYRLV